jgi:hypothetical protein
MLLVDVVPYIFVRLALQNERSIVMLTPKPGMDGLLKATYASGALMLVATALAIVRLFS